MKSYEVYETGNRTPVAVVNSCQKAYKIAKQVAQDTKKTAAVMLNNQYHGFVKA